MQQFARVRAITDRRELCEVFFIAAQVGVRAAAGKFDRFGLDLMDQRKVAVDMAVAVVGPFAFLKRGAVTAAPSVRRWQLAAASPA